MEILLKKTISGLVPMYDSDHERLKKYNIGDELKAKITKPRNLGLHRKAFALLNMAFENQEQYNSFDVFRAIVTMKAGFYTEVQTDKGLVFLPKSISYSSMDQAEFEDYYSKILDVIIKLLGCDEKEIEENLINFM